jgi:hypothetical protein
MTKQRPLTLITPVAENRKEELLEYLKNLRLGLEHNIHESFEDIGTIHFARWLVIDEHIEKNVSSMGDMPKLVLSSNFDGEVQQQLNDLCTTSAHIIDRVYACCEGYPSNSERTTAGRIAYLEKWMVTPSAFYRGAPGRTLDQIRKEERLHNFILQFIGSKKWDNQTPGHIKKEIRKAVAANAEFDWVNGPFKMPGINWLGMCLLGVALLILLPVIIVWVLIVQFGYERHDEYFTLKRSQLNEKKMQTLESYEDFEIPNQFSQLVTMKPGKVRLITYQAFMLFARLLIPFKFVKGKLMGIPTIHFARWVLFDNKKRVLFFSNFDGSWQQYLGDFIDQSGWGLTGIFSNTTKFPKTRFLITGGAYDEEHFLAWSRHSEVQTQVWYNAYPHLSIKNVNNNSLIRCLLLKNSSDKQAADFLKLI